MNEKDLIVVGGGSAGLSAAIHGAMNGLRVVVFDSSGENYDKPCGEGLMPLALTSLRELDVKVPEYSDFYGVQYIDSEGQTSSARFSGGRSGWGIRRKTLRKAFWQRARDLGIEIIDSKIDKIESFERQNHYGYQVEGFTAPHLCIAAGSNAPLLRSLGLHDGTSKQDRPQRVGLRRHAKVRPWNDLVEVYWSDFAELYVTPVSRDVVNIAILSWKPISFDDALQLFPIAKKKLDGAEWLDSVRGLSPLSHKASHVYKNNIFVAGDSAGFLDAMTGEGNALAIDSGIAVSKAILKQAGREYPGMWKRIVERYWILTSVSLWVSRPGIRRNISLKMMMTFPWLLQWGLNYIQTAPDSDFKSVK